MVIVGSIMLAALIVEGLFTSPFRARRAVDQRAAANALPASLKGNPFDPTQAYFPDELKGAIFCGHLARDLDSVAAAMGAADLYRGTAARASFEVNSETAFCLTRWGLEAPPPIEAALRASPRAGVCLVDHQQMSQLSPAVSPTRVVGVIDHHALQSETVATVAPIVIDIRPWGSSSTVLAAPLLSQSAPSASLRNPDCRPCVCCAPTL